MHPAQIDPIELLKDCQVRRGRASGPGGQHRNKVETAITLLHTPTGIEAGASERRSQEANRKTALFRLRVKLAIEYRSPEDTLAEPSALWQSRCRSGRVSVNTSHDDFPSILSEALDAIARCDWQLAPAAEHLGCTGSQLVKLLKQEPAALERLNQRRAELGQPPMR